VVAKLLLTALATTVLLAKLKLISDAADLAREVVIRRADLHAAGLELTVHAAGGLVVLLAALVLSIYKPRGLTFLGRRKQGDVRTPSQEAYLPSRPPAHSTFSGIRWGRAEPVTIRLRRANVLGFIAVVVAVHIVIMHLVSGGMNHH
jgi:hypothetical protein